MNMPDYMNEPDGGKERDTLPDPEDRTPEEWTEALKQTPVGRLMTNKDKIRYEPRIVTEADIKKDPMPGLSTVQALGVTSPDVQFTHLHPRVDDDGAFICMEPNCSEPALHSRARCLYHAEEHDRRVAEAARKQVAKDENGGMDLPEGQAETILEEAQRITSQDRNKSYGTPDQNHTLTADFLAVWLGGRYRGQSVLERLDSYDTCVFNLLQKVSRMAHQLRTEGRPQRDTLVDIAGYTQNMAMIDMARFPSKTPPRAS